MTIKDRNDINNKWRTFIKECVERQIKNKQDGERRLPPEIFVTHENLPEKYYEQHNMLNTSLRALNPALSKNFFTDSVQIELKKILNPKAFLKKSPAERMEVQRQLDTLNKDEYEWKRRLSGHNSGNDIIIELFKTSYNKFEPMYNKYTLPSKVDLEESQRAYTRFFPYKLQSFVEGMFDILILAHGLKNLQEVRKTITEKDYRIIIKEHIKPKAIFVDLVKVIMKNVRDNVFKGDSSRLNQVLSENSFVADKVDIFYEFRRVFALNVVTSVLCYYNETYAGNTIDKPDELNVSLIAEKVRYFIYRLVHIYDRDTNIWWGNDFSGSVNVIMNFLEQSDFFKGIAKEKDPNSLVKSVRTIYILYTKNTNIMLTITELPRVVEPETVTPSSIEDNLKPSLFGENRVSNSESFAEILNIAQKKTFGTNDMFLEILEALMDPTPNMITHIITKEDGISLPFKTIEQLCLIEEQIDNAKAFSSLNCFNKVIAEDLHTKIIGRNVTNVRYNHLLAIAGISPLEQKLAREADIAKYKFFSHMNQRKYAKSHIILGRIFSGMPIYIQNTYCVRLRLYPKQPFISRTSGVFKHILCEFSPIKITLKGMISLMKSFYIAAGQFEQEFEDFCKKTIISKKTGMKVLLKFFTENPIDFLNLKGNFLYATLLCGEIYTVQLTGKTAVMLEIDQKASGSVFLSLALRNRKLASYSNVISKEANCPYTYGMGMFPEFYDNFLENKDVQAFNFLSKNRKLHKFAKMCYSYSQKGMGRKEDFIERWHIEEGILTKEAKAVLVEFAFKYDAFIEFVYPGISKQIKKILKVIEIVADETGETSISNLNGEKLHWRRFKNKSVTRKSYNPVSGKQISFRIRTIETRLGKPIIDTADHKKKFLSYLIHSIDAAVMHYFILRMKKKYGYTINHLHDCVLVHPNHVDEFYEIVNELYSTDILYNIIETSVFEPAKNAVSIKGAKKIERLRKQFYKDCDDFKEELSEHLPENIYRPEG